MVVRRPNPPLLVALIAGFGFAGLITILFAGLRLAWLFGTARERT